MSVDFPLIPENFSVNQGYIVYVTSLCSTKNARLGAFGVLKLWGLRDQSKANL